MSTAKWASWQQQQTLEELNKLKNSTIGVDGRIALGVKPLDPQTILSKNSRLLSKFTAKKLSQSGQSQSSPQGYSSSYSNAMNDSTNNRSSFAPSASVSTQAEWPESAHAAVRKLEEERDQLLREKSSWLARICDDNTRLASLLKEVSSVKVRLTDKMAALDVEKDKLRALQINFAQNRFEKSFFAGSKLSPENRQIFDQQGRGDKAAEVYDHLVALWAHIKANQMDVVNLAVNYIKDVENAMMQGNDDDAERLLEQLSNIASGRPGNVLAAQALSSNLSEAVVNALMERNLAPLLIKPTEDQDNALVTNYDYFFGPLATNAQQNSQSLSYNDIKEILAQNQSLKAQLQSMKTKCAQLKTKALAAQQQLVQQQNTNSPGIGKSSSSKRIGNGSVNNLFDADGVVGGPQPTGTYAFSGFGNQAMTSSELADNLDTLALDESNNVGAAAASEVDVIDYEDVQAVLSSGSVSERRLSDGSLSLISPNENYDHLPQLVKDVCSEAVSQRIKELMQTNPLFPAVSACLHPQILNETAAELYEQMKGSISVLLLSLEDVQAVIDIADKQLSTPQDDSESEAAMRTTVDAAVKSVLRSVAIDVELNTLITMSLTFLHHQYVALTN